MKKPFLKMLSLLLIVLSLFTIVSCDNTQNETVKRANEEYIKYLEETYANYAEVSYGLDITKKYDLVGICYTTWFTAIQSDPNYKFPNITEILTGNGRFQKEGTFHYWAEPDLGYYRSDNKEVIRTHMTQLADIGVDYIIIDNTNASRGWTQNGGGLWDLYITKPCVAILDTIVEMRSEGKKTPYVVFWSNTDAANAGWDVVNRTYNQFIKDIDYKDCFVYWDGKPFMLITENISGKPRYDLTIRCQWGLNANRDKGDWSFLDHINLPAYDVNNYAEQICVSPAAQRDYMSNAATAQGRNHGIFYYTQWTNAFKYRPKTITISWWNEWTAQAFYRGQKTPSFVDNYNQEYSRDIEPMKNGHRDLYYQWTKQYIEAYKNYKECPRLVEDGY